MGRPPSRRGSRRVARRPSRADSRAALATPSPADVVGALVERSGLEGEDIEHVRVLERFSLAEVPAERASQAVERVGGSLVKGRELRLQVLGNGARGASA